MLLRCALAVALCGLVAAPASAQETTTVSFITGRVSVNLPYQLQQSAGALLRPQDIRVTLSTQNKKSITIAPSADLSFAIPMDPGQNGQRFTLVATAANGRVTSDTATGIFGSQNANVPLTISRSTTTADAVSLESTKGSVAYAGRRFDFVTDRQIVGSAYGAQTDSVLHFGQFDGYVRLATSTVPSGWGPTTRPTATGDSVTKQLGSADTDSKDDAGLVSFVKEVHAKGPDVLLFIHGFNVTLSGSEDALLRLAFEADWRARPAIVYSWASKGDWHAYASDGDTVSNPSAVNHLHDFIARLESAVPGIRLHVVVHSMGHRLLFAALNNSEDRIGHGIASVHYFAGDVPADAFDPIGIALQKVHVQQRYYFSLHDLVLHLSSCINHANRFGEGVPMVPGGVVSFNAALLANPDDGFGHGYFLNTLSVAKDINTSLNGGTATTFSKELSKIPWLKDRPVPLVDTYYESFLEGPAACSIASAIL